MADYLLEIGTEELPASAVAEARERLGKLLAEALASARLNFKDIRTYATPRRVACIVHDLAAIQPTTTKKVKGPPVQSGFDADGNPLPAAVGFARKHGIAPEELKREDVGGIEYLFANLTVEGLPAGQVLQQLVPTVVREISGERLMRWGDSDFRFLRPVRWLVSMLNGDEVLLSLDGIKSGRVSYGHRILSAGLLTLNDPGSYIEELRRGNVLVDPEERRKTIIQAVQKAAGAVSGSCRRLNEDLLDEVVNLTEWPQAILGEFSPEYLDLPEALIETVMVHHQRYFPVEKAGAGSGGRSALLPYFVAVADNDRQEARATIRRGYERVLRARLADGRFFYFDDQKVKLSERKGALAQLTFHERLGSYLDKQERMLKIARALSERLSLDPRLSVCLETTLELCKLDLVTNLVGELPELQGHVGSWYAEAEGKPPDVVTALASHYSPRSTHDTIPADTAGQFVAVIDKLDNLVGLFAQGKRPRGSSDPYVMRRQAQGLVDIIMDGLSQSYRLDLTRMMTDLLELYRPWLEKDKQAKDPEGGLADLREFLIGRVRLKLQESGYGRELIESVLLSKDPLADLGDVRTRLACLSDFLRADGGIDLIRAGVRVGNILEPGSPLEVDVALFEAEAESKLWERFNEQVVKVWQDSGQFRQPVCADDYRLLLSLVAVIGPDIDRLFDDVMVNDPDAKMRANRHGLLSCIDLYFKTVADFTKLQPLLP